MICTNCFCEYNRNERIGKPGKLTHCPECADEIGDVQVYTGNMIYSHKTAPSIQINKDPRLTAVLNGRIEGDTEYSSDAVAVEAESFVYKGKD